MMIFYYYKDILKQILMYPRIVFNIVLLSNTLNKNIFKIILLIKKKTFFLTFYLREDC